MTVGSPTVTGRRLSVWAYMQGGWQVEWWEPADILFQLQQLSQ